MAPVVPQSSSFTAEKGLRALLGLFVLGAGISEALAVEPVVRSLEALGYPRTLIPLLAAAKLSAVGALWGPAPTWLREWAYAGLTIDFVGATYSFFASGQLLLPDVVLAPTCLVLTLLSSVLWRRSVAVTPARIERATPTPGSDHSVARGQPS
ncbi:MAG: DoxX family protein [Myxococcaceae bacterium]|nr:DoxX family protein [Myxococcaceae bacterium]MCA3016330.1 DoxX family protein [Myxococcaceae bacterium]